MDFLFHMQQGKLLLETKEVTSIRRAIEHFTIANRITEDWHPAKPKILYMLALGNLFIGNVERSYKIALKAKISIDLAVEHSIILEDNLRQKFGEDEIDELITHIKNKYPQSILSTLKDTNDFDENKLDFDNVNKLYPLEERRIVKSQFVVDQLSDEILMATFAGQGRTNEELIYFDKLKGDVLSHVQGYFSPLTGDQSSANRRLSNRIINHEPIDMIDEERYVLIDRLRLTEFLNEYTKQAEGKEPFSSYVNFFSIEVLKEFEWIENIKTTDDIIFGNHCKKMFHDLFYGKYQNSVHELRNDYSIIYENSCKTLALNWIKKILSKEDSVIS